MNVISKWLRSRLPSRSFLRSFQEKQLVLQGRALTAQIRLLKEIKNLEQVEFSVFSQWGDDGIIQWLTGILDFDEKCFIEFGVEDYRESNTRFLLFKDNWSGLIFDASRENIKNIKTSEYFWKHELEAVQAFVEPDNVNELIGGSKIGRNADLLHIDIDGMDYWVWEALQVISPKLVILEYNSLFGEERAITVPYKLSFDRTEAHFSNLYFGASLPAMIHLSKRKGYDFIGCNSAGNNAYFVKNEFVPMITSALNCKGKYVQAKFVENRNQSGLLEKLDRSELLGTLRGLPLVDVYTNESVSL